MYWRKFSGTNKLQLLFNDYYYFVRMQDRNILKIREQREKFFIYVDVKLTKQNLIYILLLFIGA